VTIKAAQLACQPEGQIGQTAGTPGGMSCTVCMRWLQKRKEKKRKEKKRKERKRKERKGKERKGKERKGKERKGKEKKRKEKKRLHLSASI